MIRGLATAVSMMRDPNVCKQIFITILLKLVYVPIEVFTSKVTQKIQSFFSRAKDTGRLTNDPRRLSAYISYCGFN